MERICSWITEDRHRTYDTINDIIDEVNREEIEADDAIDIIASFIKLEIVKSEIHHRVENEEN